MSQCVEHQQCSTLSRARTAEGRAEDERADRRTGGRTGGRTDGCTDVAARGREFGPHVGSDPVAEASRAGHRRLNV